MIKLMSSIMVCLLAFQFNLPFLPSTMADDNLIGTTYFYGDADLDGDVDEEDYQAILECAVGIITLSGEAYDKADINRDGAVDAFDAFYLNRYLNTKIPPQENPFVGEEIMVGDVNGDGVINMTDYGRLLNFVMGFSKPTEIEKKALDVNGDGKLNFTDLTYLRNFFN